MKEFLEIRSTNIFMNIWRNNIINNSYNKFQAAVALIADTQFIMVEDAK